MGIAKDEWSVGELIPVGEAELSRIGMEVKNTLEVAIGDRAAVDQTLQKNRDSFENKLHPKDWPWIGCSNISFPLSTEKVLAINSRLFPIFHPNSAFWGFKPLNADAEQRAPRTQTWLDYDIRKHPKFLNAKYYASLGLSLRDGVGVYKNFFVDKRRKERVVQKEFDVETGQWKRKFSKQEVSVFKGVSGRPVEFKDFGIIPFNARSIDEAIGVWERMWMWAYDIQREIDQGNFYPQAESVIKFASNQPDMVSVRQGIQGSSYDPNPLYRPVDLYSVRLPIDLKLGDGRLVNGEIFKITIHRQSGIVVRIEPYDFDMISEEYHVFSVYPRFYDFYAFGVPELVGPLKAMMDSILNQWIDAGTLSNNPIIFHTGDVFLNNKPFGPGVMMQVTDINQFQVSKLPDPGPFPLQLKMLLQEQADKVLGDYDLTSSALGRAGQKKSMKEVEALMMALVSRTDWQSALCKQTLKGIGLSHLRLEYLYGDEQLQVPKAMGNVNDDVVSKEDLAAKYDLEPAGQIRGYNEMEKSQQAMLEYNMLLQSVFVGGAGVMPPRLDRIWQVTHDVMEANNVKDIESRIGKKEEALAMQQQLQQAQQQQGPGAQTPGAQQTLGNLLGQGGQAFGGGQAA